MAILSPLNKWLNYVDRQLEEIEGVAYLKLALHSEIDQGILASIKTPSLIFRELKDRHGQEALPLYHRALLTMGGKLRGRMCVNNAKQLFGLDLPPPISPQKQSKKFKFFQCVTRIGKVLRGQEGEEKLLIYFSRKNHLNTHHRNIHGLPDLFVQLLNDRIVTENNTKALYVCLQHYNLEEAIRYLNEYHGSISGEMSATDEQQDKDDDSPDPTSALTSSVEPAHRLQLFKKQSQLAAPQEQKSTSGGTEAAQTLSTAPEGLYSHHTDQDFVVGTSVEGGVHRPLTKSTESQTETLEQMEREVSTGRGHKNKRICLCSLLLLLNLIFLLLLGVLALFSQYLWHPLHSAGTNSHPQPTLQQQGQTLVLTEVKETIVQEVTVQELVYGSDSPHIIDIFLVRSACDGLAKNSTSYYYSGSRDQFISNVTYYLMPRSEIKYNICASSNHSKADIIQVYIIEGLQQDRNFSPDNDYDDEKVKFFPVDVGRNGRTSCTLIRFEVHYWNYYTIRTFIHNKQWVAQAHYDLIIEEVSIDLSQTKDIISNRTLDSDNKEETYHFPFEFNSWCLVADIHTETISGFGPYVHTLMKYTVRYVVVLGVTVTISILLVVGSLVVLSVMCCIRWRMVEKCLTKYKVNRKHRCRIEGREYSSLST